MPSTLTLEGVIPSVVTPLGDDDQVRLDNLRHHIRTLAAEGCDGVLLTGTTGEGPSLGLAEREAVIKAGLEAAEGMTVLAGTGCASLTETVYLTRRAYELGVNATLVIPPFFFKNVSDDGLLAFYRRLLDEAVPSDGSLLLYHFPKMSQVPITSRLLEDLLAIDSERITGIKDSSGSLEHLGELCRRFPQLQIFPGNDRLFLAGLEMGAAGTITAPSNCFAPLNVNVYRAFKGGQNAAKHQEKLTLARSVIDRHPSLPASQKYLLSRRYGSSGWELRPPLVPLSPSAQEALDKDLVENGVTQWLDW
jgi:4-hydroxy-tetrahydrodipicolinate synthase